MAGFFRKWAAELSRMRMKPDKAAAASVDASALDTLHDSVPVDAPATPGLQPLLGAGLICSNCDTPLTGHFCHACGQKDADLRRPIWLFAEEIVDNVLQADNKMIRSLLWLIFVPGGMTAEFMRGRRARFSPPVRLYFIASIVFFLVLSVADVLILDIKLTPKPVDVTAPAAAPAPSPKADQIPADVQKALDDAGVIVPDEAQAAIDARLGKDLADNVGKGDTVRVGRGIHIDDDNFPYDVEVGMFVKNTGEPHYGLSNDQIADMLDDPDTPEFMKQATRGFSRALANPTAFNDLFNNWLPKALVILVPLFALILRIFHWGKRRYFMNQLIFSLHFHTFLFILLMALIAIVPRSGGEWGIRVFWGGTSIYLIIALKVAEEQSWIRAFLKAGFIWVSYLFFMSLVLTFAVLNGLKELDGGSGSIGQLFGF